MGTKGKVIGLLHEIDDPTELAEIAKEARRLAQNTGFDRFHTGMKVAFTPTKGAAKGNKIVGEVTRINKKTVTVENLEPVNEDVYIRLGTYYRIHPTSDWWEEVPYNG